MQFFLAGVIVLDSTSIRKVSMEQQIQDLVDSIRSEGIEKAKRDAAAIMDEAEARAKAIVADAEKERDRLIADAEERIGRERSSAEASIRQAARDVSLSLKKSIEDTYTAILKAECGKAMHGDALLPILKSVITSGFSGEAVEISPEDMEALSERLSSLFADEIRKGLEFRPSPRVSSGFRISEKDGSGYIDVTGEEAAGLLAPYLSSSIRALVERQ